METIIMLSIVPVRQGGRPKRLKNDQTQLDAWNNTINNMKWSPGGEVKGLIFMNITPKLEKKAINKLSYKKIVSLSSYRPHI